LRLPLPKLAFATLAFALCASMAFAAAPPSTDDMSLGNPKAKLQVDEYASASCTHCAHFNNEVFPAFKKKYIDTGKVHYTLHEFLTPPENVAAAGFLVARCAGPDKYFQVLDDFFHRQAEMYEKRDLKAPLLAAGQAGGLDEAAVTACLQDKPQIEALQTRLKAAMDSGVTATPTFFINGEKVGEGSLTLEQLDAAIAKAKPIPKKK
jgi:protein-disulfide isomerase